MKAKLTIRISIERTRVWSRLVVWLRRQFAPEEIKR
jgi:hypothetical protein